MIKQTIYTYLGLNGTLTTTIQLEGIYSVRHVRLLAEGKNVLTKDGKTFVKAVTVPEAEVELWKEVPGQN